MQAAPADRSHDGAGNLLRATPPWLAMRSDVLDSDALGQADLERDMLGWMQDGEEESERAGDRSRETVGYTPYEELHREGFIATRYEGAQWACLGFAFHFLQRCT